MSRYSVFGLLGLVVWSGLAAAALDRSQVTVVTASDRHVFDVEIADDPEERSTGLMNRDALAENAGMLFDFGTVKVRSMWMKDTFISLDMLFVDPTGRIISIAHRTVPKSRRSISSGAPVLAVLEISGGRARELGITPGDTLIHDIFDSGA